MRIKTNILLLSIILFTGFINFAQTVSANWSNTHSIQYGLEENAGISENSLNFYQNLPEGERVLISLDKTLKTHLFSDMFSNISEENRTGTILDFFQIGNELYVGIAEMVFKDKWVYAIYKFNINNGGKPIVDSRQDVYTTAWGTSINKAIFKKNASPDASKRVVLVEHPLEKKKETSTIGLCVVSEEGVALSETFVLPFSSRKWTKYEIQIDNAGNVILSANYKENKVWFTDYWYLPFGTKTLQKITLPKDEEVVQIVSFPQGLNSNRIFGLTNKIKPSAAGEDVYHSSYFTINVNNQIIEETMLKPVSQELFSSFYRKDAAENQFTALPNMDIVDGYSLTNGDHVLLLESSTVRKQYVAGTGGAGNSYYNYDVRKGNILLLCFGSEKGELKWFKTIPKYQKSFGRSDKSPKISFISGCVKDQIYVLYNKTDNSAEKPIGGKVTQNEGDGQLFPVMLTMLNGDGEFLVGNAQKAVYLPNFYGSPGREGLFVRAYPKVSNFEGNQIIISSNASKNKVRFGKLQIEG